MKFSIVTITHNRAHLIGKTIESVLNQTYQNFEHIIIDDGSTDNTEDVVKSYNDKRISYFYYRKQDKRSFLRNEGIRKSEGDIICILDSDDIWNNNKLITLVDIFNTKKEVVFIIHNVLKIDDENLIYNYKTNFYRNVLKDILNNKILPYPFYSFRRSILNEIEMYDEKMVDGQHDLFLRYAAQYPFYFIAKTLSRKTIHTENISQRRRVSALLNLNITLQKLKDLNKISFKEYKYFKSINDSKIVKFYIHNKEKQKGIKYLNKVLKETSLVSKIHIRLLILKFTNGWV